jgi:hypothetical protein
MSRYIPSDAEQEAIAHLRAQGWHVERAGTAQRRLDRLAITEHRLEWAEREAAHVDHYREQDHAERRRLSDRLVAVVAAAAAVGVPFPKIQEALGETDKLGQRAAVREGRCGLYYAISNDGLLTAICILDDGHDGDHSNSPRRSA